MTKYQSSRMKFYKNYFEHYVDSIVFINIVNVSKQTSKNI